MRRTIPGWSFYGGRERLAENDIFRCVIGDVGNVYFEVFVRVCVPSVSFQREVFPLAGKSGGGDDINKEMATIRLTHWYKVLDDGREGCGVMMGGIWVVGRVVA